MKTYDDLEKALENALSEIAALEADRDAAEERLASTRASIVETLDALRNANVAVMTAQIYLGRLCADLACLAEIEW